MGDIMRLMGVLEKRQVYIVEVSHRYRGGDLYAKRKTIYMPLLQFHGHHPEGRSSDEDARRPGHPVLPKLQAEVHA